MEKHLFTKIPLEELHSHSEFVANSMMTELVKNTHSQLREKQIKHA